MPPIKKYALIYDEQSGSYQAPGARLTDDGEYHPDDIIPDGEYVPAQTAEMLYRALEHIVDHWESSGTVTPFLISSGKAALEYGKPNPKKRSKR